MEETKYIRRITTQPIVVTDDFKKEVLIYRELITAKGMDAHTHTTTYIGLTLSKVYTFFIIYLGKRETFQYLTDEARYETMNTLGERA